MQAGNTHNWRGSQHRGRGRGGFNPTVVNRRVVVTTTTTVTGRRGRNPQRAAEMHYVIRNVHSNLVLDVEGGNHHDGAHICLWNFHGGDNQLWHVDHQNGHIRSKLHGKALDVEGGRAENGSRVILYSPHGGKNQRWEIGHDRSIRSHLGNLVLDGTDNTPGAKVVVWHKHGGPHQQFILEVAP